MQSTVVVVGGGYAGVAAARGLAKRAPRGATITLVHERPDFVERVRLHQFAAGQPRSHLPLSRLVGGRVNVQVDTVTDVDLVRRRVHLAATPVPLGYDVLVYALGSGPAPSPVPGMDEVAHTVASLPTATRLRTALQQLDAGASVTVVGGGLTGIEVAAEVAESLPHLRVQMITSGALGQGLAPRAREHLGRAPERVGVTVRDGTEVSQAMPAALLTTQGTTIASDLTVWAGGFRVPPLAADAGLAVDSTGRVLVDDDLRSISHPDVYAIGDVAAAAAAGGTPTRMCCQTALPMGSAVARVVAADLRGEHLPAKPTRYVWTTISVGRRDAVTQFTHANDSPARGVITGAAAAGFKELITRSTVFTRTRGNVRA